ncbi:MAG TPA: SH3 domain-containing protein [Alphaproteobacteria bacterium]
MSLFLTAGAHAQDAQSLDTVAENGQAAAGVVSGLPLPRFVSLRSDTVYVRAGPGMRYPVKWVYQSRSYPLQVIQEFDTWRKIKDIDGDEGWVHQTLLSGNRYVLIESDQPVTLYKKPDEDSRPVAQAEKGVVAKLNECEDNWCQVSVSGYKGWLLKEILWGVYEHEESK